METLTYTIKQMILDHGMALVGIAPVDRFAQVPDGRKPEVILPGARSVIVFGQAMSRGAVQAKFRALEDGNTAADSIYGRYSRNGMSTVEIMAVSYTVANYIERTLHSVAVPMMTGSWAFARPFSLRHAAVAAGLGQFGLNKSVITRQYGPRVRWGAIITQLELEYDDMDRSVPLCPGESCGKCHQVCPTAALDSTKRITFQMGDQKISYIDVDVMACKAGCMALTKASGGEQDLVPQLHPTSEEVQAGIDAIEFAPGDMLIPPTWHCDRCIVYCPTGDWDSCYRNLHLTEEP